MSSRNLWQFVRACEAQHLDADLRDFVEHAQRFRYPAAAVDVEEQRRRVARDVLAEARCAQRTWLAYQHLPVTDPEPGQWHDTLLGSKIAITSLAKRSGVTYGLRKFFGLTQRHYEAPGGMIAEAVVNCREISPRALAEACAGAAQQSLDQMLGHGAPAGRIIGAVANSTTAYIRALVTDAAAIAKLAHQVYAGVIMEFDEANQLHRISLVDSGELAKGGGGNVICKVFDRSAEVKKKLAKQARKLSRETGRSVADCVAALQQVRKSSAPAQRLWPSAEAVLGEQARVNALRQTRAADGLVVKALQERVTNAKGVELVKAARANPFNRLGGPRHQL